MIQAYQLTPRGASARLALFRQMARDSAKNPNPQTRLQPDDWKGARHYKLNSYESAYGLLWQGDGEWHSHTMHPFRDERDADDIVSDLSGYLTDEYSDETAIGIVCRLTHGRFIAGYRWTSNDERVYFPDVFTDEDDAARMADEHARVFAESAREDSERFNAMTDAEGHVESVESDVNHAFQTRNVGAWHREQCRERIEELKSARQDLADATAAYERGY